MNVHGQWVLPWMAATPATPTVAASATPTMSMQAVQMTSMLGQQQLLNKMLTANGNAGLPQQNNSLVHQQQHQHQQHQQQHQQQQQQQQYMILKGFAIHPSMLTTTNPTYFGLSALGSQPQGMAAAAAAAAAAQIQSQHTTSLLASQAMVASKSPLLRTPLFASKAVSYTHLTLPTILLV